MRHQLLGNRWQLGYVTRNLLRFAQDKALLCARYASHTKLRIGSTWDKIVGVYDAAGRLVDFVLVPGQANELAPWLLLLKRRPKTPAWALADMAYDAKEFRLTVEIMGAIPVIPSCKGTNAYSADPDHPLRPIVITDSCDRDHGVHSA